MTYEEIKRRKQGYKVGMEDIRSFGIESCKSKFALRLCCTGIDACFTVGYGEAIVDVCRRMKACEDEIDGEDEEFAIEPWEYELRRN